MQGRYLDIARKVVRDTKVEQLRGDLEASKSQREPSDSLEPDTWIQFESPCFGRCTGRIAIVHDEYEWMLVADHSVTKDFAFISKRWGVALIESLD